MQNLFKSNYFVSYSNIKIINKINNDNTDIEKNNNDKINTINKKIVRSYNPSINIQNELKNKDFLKNQDNILNILLKLRNFDEKNGTELFKNISYNSLNSFILKNTI